MTEMLDTVSHSHKHTHSLTEALSCVIAMHCVYILEEQ